MLLKCNLNWPVFVILGALLAGCASLGNPIAGQGDTNGTNVVSGSSDEFSKLAGRTLLFEEGSVALSAKAEATLQRQVGWLKENPQWLVKIQGHADDPGSEATNKALSQLRAEVVLEALVAKGVDRKRMWVKGYGIERPVTDCDPAECQRLNRRVVLNLRDAFDDAAPRAKRNNMR